MRPVTTRSHGAVAALDLLVADGGRPRVYTPRLCARQATRMATV